MVVRLHYTADSHKRDPAWKTATGRNMHPRDWQREMEIDWSAPEGAPVVPEFQEITHVREFSWDSSLKCLRGWDFGAVSPVVLFAQLTLWGQLRIRRELCPFNTPVNQLWPMVQAVTVELAGREVLLDGEAVVDLAGREVPFDAGDPAGFNQTDLGSSAEYLAAQGVLLHAARPGTEVSYADLRGRFLRQVMEPGHGPVPAILVHPECRLLRGALSGGFHLSPFPPYKPVKVHPEKDVVDALRYLHDNLAGANKRAHEEQRRMAAADAQETRAQGGWSDVPRDLRTGVPLP